MKSFLRQIYLRLVKPFLRPEKAAAFSHFLGDVHDWFFAEYHFWRVKYPFTAILGTEHKRSRDRIEIDITYACNLNCFNCNRSCEQAPTSMHMTVEQIQHFVDESVAKGKKWERIRLVGGEPTIHKDFFQILNILRNYRDQHSPKTELTLTTNGFGDKVNSVIARIPADVHVLNTAKVSQDQPSFSSFNVAPRDLPEYAGTDFANACYIPGECGIGLGPSGYYPCAVAGGIDRIFGWNLGKQEMPEDSDEMKEQLRKFCSQCGHFKRRLEKQVDGPLASQSWREGYAQYKKQRPALTLYGTPPTKKKASGE